jgi:hypothetical protein
MMGWVFHGGELHRNWWFQAHSSPSPSCREFRAKENVVDSINSAERSPSRRGVNEHDAGSHIDAHYLNNSPARGVIIDPRSRAQCSGECEDMSATDAFSALATQGGLDTDADSGSWYSKRKAPRTKITAPAIYAEAFLCCGT